VDKHRVFLEQFESQVGSGFGDHIFGLYVAALQEHSPEFVDMRLDALSTNVGFPATGLLAAIRFGGATVGNRARLRKLMQNERWNIRGGKHV